MIFGITHGIPAFTRKGGGAPSMDDGSENPGGGVFDGSLLRGAGTSARLFRAVATVTAAAVLWLSGPQFALAASRKPAKVKPYSALKPGLTQTPDAALRAKIDARAKAAAKPHPDVVALSEKEMRAVTGRGPYRNAYFAGAPMPWHRSLRDVNLCTGSLFKSFTDFQIAPARGAGLVLQRTYSSQDERVGPFGIGWTHAYDIRIAETNEVQPDTGDEVVVRKDFFGGTHKYTRDADGLYTPPAYMYDEMDSEYDQYLTDGPPQVVEDVQKGMDGTVKHFVSGGTKADGALSGERVCDYMEDRHGNRTTLDYGLTVTAPDGSTKKLLTQVTDPSGRTLTFTWNNLGTSAAPAYRIVQVQGPAGTYRVTYQYNNEFNLQSVTLDPDGLSRTTTYGYTSGAGETGLLSSITDPLGHAVTYGYGDPQDNIFGVVWVQSVTEPAGVTTAGTPRTQTWTMIDSSDPYSGVFGYTVLSSFMAVQAITCYSDSLLRVVDVYAAGGFSGHYRFEYDDNNNVTRSGVTYVGASGIWLYPEYTVATYGPHGNVLTQERWGFPGVATTTYYDASKYFQKASVTDPNGHTTTFDYFDSQDPAKGNRGEVKWVRDARYSVTGKQFEYAYNQYGQKVAEKNLNDVVTKYTYGDAWGNLTQVVQDPSDPTTSYTGLNRTSGMSYDVYGRIGSSTDPNGQTSTFTYNNLGQPTAASFPAAENASAETVTYSYAANGRTETVTDGRGTTSIAYEAGCDWAASVTDPVTGTVSYTYLPSGERKTMTLPNGDVTTYTYGPEENGGYAGDSGAMMPEGEPDSLALTLKRITDTQGRQVELFWWNYGYGENIDPNLNNTVGRLFRIRYNQTFDSGGGLASYCETQIKYDTSGGRSNSRAKALVNRFYNLQTSQVSVLSRNDYTYDDAGRRTANQITDSQGNGRTETYGYDELNRLTAVTYGDGQTQGYTFDPMGNRLTKTDNQAGNESYGYNSANMLTSRTHSGTTFQYSNSATGNLLQNSDVAPQYGSGSKTYYWDTQNRLAQYIEEDTPNNSVVRWMSSTMRYGADGLRRRKVTQIDNYDPQTNTFVDSTTTQTDYILDGQNVVQEIVRQGQTGQGFGNPTTVTYLQGPNGPMYRRYTPASGGGTTDVRWYVYDGLGSVVGEVDVNGTLTASTKYDVYGATRGQGGSSTTRHGWQGGIGHHSDDETGMVYMRARYYNSAVGRFASEDPAHHGNNWFMYASGDPVNRSDATGKYDGWIPGTCLSIGLALAGAAVITALFNTPGAFIVALNMAAASVWFSALGLNAGSMQDGSYGIGLGIAAISLRITGIGSYLGMIGTALQAAKEGAKGAGKLAAIAVIATFAYTMACIGALMAIDFYSTPPEKMFNS